MTNTLVSVLASEKRCPVCGAAAEESDASRVSRDAAIGFQCGAIFADERGAIRAVSTCPTPSLVQAELLDAKANGRGTLA